MPTVVTSPVGCPRFFVSKAVSSGLCPGTCVVPSRSVSPDLDTLTPVFQFALVVGGTDTSRRTGPQLVLFQCLPLESSGPGSLELYLGVCPRVLYFFSVLWKYGYVTCDIYIKCGVFLCVYTDCGLVFMIFLLFFFKFLNRIDEFFVQYLNFQFQIINKNQQFIIFFDLV
ncbi:hypothetical protein Taro_045402 [Colocasia esculenta]|uniref:Uncharacterized protein n=1 Tax=Colocasia esculenta TaxID=4460 RepID=A0A843WPC9_COLES|nr:hypothetical protein [Colocasia esculenta]